VGRYGPSSWTRTCWSACLTRSRPAIETPAGQFSGAVCRPIGTPIWSGPARSGGCADGPTMGRSPWSSAPRIPPGCLPIPLLRDVPWPERHPRPCYRCYRCYRRVPASGNASIAARSASRLPQLTPDLHRRPPEPGRGDRIYRPVRISDTGEYLCSEPSRAGAGRTHSPYILRTFSLSLLQDVRRRGISQ
jgi:hypothetical protein